MRANIAAAALCLFVALIAADVGDALGTLILLLCAVANGVIIVHKLIDNL